MTKKTRVMEIIAEKKCKGTYIMHDAAKGDKIVASGPDPCKLFIEARKMHVKIPTLEYIPEHSNLNVF